MFRPAALIALIFAACFEPPAAADARPVGIRMAASESPGATVPAIVTAFDVPAGSAVSIRALGTRGALARCAGPVWFNRARATASRQCSLRLPARTGAYRIVALARVEEPGGTVDVRDPGRRVVRARGPRSETPMSLAQTEAIDRCFNATDDVWLTFDDGGSEAQVRAILATLARNGVRGRFFFTGRWAAANPSLLSEIEAGGHLLGNHSFSHAALNGLSAAAVLEEIDQGIRATTTPLLLRPPSGAGAFSSRLASLAARRGYRLCRWTVNTGDHRGATADEIVERIREGDARTPPIAAGGNILLHGTGEHTSTGLQQIIDAVRAEGLTLDRLPG